MKGEIRKEVKGKIDKEEINKEREQCPECSR
jgi:hypothetical protein